MSMTVRTPIAVAALVATLGAAALLPLAARPGGQPREIVLVARQMSFYLGPDGTVRNPVIRVTPGERVRLTLINNDAGFDHDVAIEAWGIGSSLVRGEGRTTIDVHAPDEPRRVDYVCTRHAAMMRGTIEVTPRGGGRHSRGS